MERLARSLGIENLSHSQVSEMTKGLNEYVDSFRNQSLSERRYPILRVDALYEKVRIDGRIVNMAVMVVCGVDEHGQRDVLAIEPMLEESEATYLLLFRSLQERSLRTPRLVISDAYSGLMTAIRKGFPGTSWQRCKVHFMRNILARVPHKKYVCTAAIWFASTREQTYRRVEYLCRQYERRFPKAIRCLGDGLEDSLPFYAFPQLDARKISSTNVLERLNREI